AQMGGQGPDRGSEYRSAIIPVTPHQARIAGAYLAQLAEMKPTTRIEPYRAFYPAENAHQDFARRHPQHPYPRVGRAAYRRARPALSAALQRWLDRALSGAIWVS
ncbi:MAG: peptide-methionine (S)-S-oxide reductase, partial [Pelagerythrobacter marensis]